MENEIVKEYLKCPLNEQELKQQAERMSQCLSQIQSYQNDLKSIRTQIQSDIARCEGDLASAVEKFRSGFEMRNVECRVDKNFETNTVQIYRLDTGEMIREKAMTAEERQLILDLQKPPAELKDLDAGHPFYKGEKKEAESTQ